MKRIINEMKLRLPAISVNESVARSVISAFSAELNPRVEELGDLRCAVSEAVTNCIVHAYRNLPDGEIGYIYISVRLYDTREITVEISDNGVVALGGRFDLPRTMIAASVINTIRSYGYRIQFVAAILGAALTMLHTFLYPDLPSGFSLLIALLFQGIFTAVAWLATRLIFRFGSSENLK